MKVVIPRSSLLAGLDRVIRVVPTSKAVPILTYVRLDADQTMTITGSDLATSIVVTLPDAVVKEPGSALLPAADLLALLRSATNTYAALVSEEHGVKIKIGAHARLEKTPAPDQFPPVPQPEAQWTHTLPRHALAQALRLVRSAVPRMSLNPRLEQVAIRQGKVLGCDGIRLHQADLPAADLVDAALPLDFVTDVLRLLSQTDADTVEIGLPADRQAVIVRDRDVVLTCANLTGDYPDVAPTLLVPAMTNTMTMKAERVALAGAVRRVSAKCDPSSRAIRLSLSNFSRLEVSGQEQDGSWATEILPVEWSDADRTLTFNHEHLSDLLALFDGEHVTLRLGPDTRHKPSPVLITEDGRAGVLTQLRMEWAT